jgi:hypothetical protein
LVYGNSLLVPGVDRFERLLERPTVAVNTGLSAMLMNEVIIFQPNSRKKQATITSPFAAQVVTPLSERLGAEAAEKAKKHLSHMQRHGIESMQIRIGERRIRLRQTEI